MSEKKGPLIQTPIFLRFQKRCFTHSPWRWNRGSSNGLFFLLLLLLLLLHTSNFWMQRQPVHVYWGVGEVGGGGGGYSTVDRGPALSMHSCFITKTQLNRPKILFRKQIPQKLSTLKNIFKKKFQKLNNIYNEQKD